MGCPKCGYSGHNSVYHWGTGERECEKCRHDYVPESKSSKKKDESLGFLTPNFKKPYTYLYPPNDVWMSDSGKVSVGFPTLGSRCIGHESNNSVFDDHGFFVGRITGEHIGTKYLDRR